VLPKLSYSPFSNERQAGIHRETNWISLMPENPFLWLIDELIWIYICVLFATAVLSWLIAFEVVNTRNDFVRSLANFLYRITEPALRPIRNALPNLGGIDVSPVILMIGLLFLSKLIHWLWDWL
jgi:YggT family protein